jgi:hypothetical protein
MSDFDRKAHVTFPGAESIWQETLALSSPSAGTFELWMTSSSATLRKPDPDIRTPQLYIA